MWLCADLDKRNSINFSAFSLFCDDLSIPAPLIFMWVPLPF
jgi:hypothetical protein